MTAAWALLALTFLLIAANAIFVAAEFAFVTVDRPTVDKLATTGDRRATSMQTALKSLSTELSGAQLGITVTSLLVGFIAEPSIATLLREPIDALGLPDQTAVTVSLIAAFVLATGTQMVFGELVPKNWAIAEPVRAGRAVVGFQRGFTWLSRPLLRILNGAANNIVRSMGMEPKEELESARSVQELESLAQRSGEEGTLEPDVARRLSRAAELRERTASDAMTPRPRLHFVEADDTVDKVLALASRTGHARFPVLGDNVDDIIGVAHFKQAIAIPPRQRSTVRVRDIALDVDAVPSSMPLNAVLEKLREGAQMAVVVDEYGGTDGIITLEDLVEEIVGEIEDEQDQPVSSYRKIGDRRWSVSGLLRPDEAGDLAGVVLPEAEESDTLGGLLTERLQRFPRVGDILEVEARDEDNRDDDGIAVPTTVTLKVTRLDGHRVDRVIIDVDTSERDDDE